MILPLFLIPILAGLTAQALKPLLNRHMYATLNEQKRRIPRYGGMPSAHSAFIFSLATIVGLVDGVYSTTFALAASAVVLILDDALRLRIFLAHYGQALSKLVERVPRSEQTRFPSIETQLGHKPREAIIGALLGTAVSLALYWLML